MLKQFFIFMFSCLFSVGVFAQNSPKTAISTPKTPKTAISTGANARTIKPSTKPLSVKPANSQPKEVIVEEITIVRSPRRPAIRKGTQGENATSNAAQNTKSVATDTRSMNISKTVAMPEE